MILRRIYCCRSCIREKRRGYFSLNRSFLFFSRSIVDPLVLLRSFYLSSEFFFFLILRLKEGLVKESHQAWNDGVFNNIRDYQVNKAKLLAIDGKWMGTFIKLLICIYEALIVTQTYRVFIQVTIVGLATSGEKKDSKVSIYLKKSNNNLIYEIHLTQQYPNPALQSPSSLPLHPRHAHSSPRLMYPQTFRHYFETSRPETARILRHVP